VLINYPSVNGCVGQIAVMVLIYDKKIDRYFFICYTISPWMQEYNNKQSPINCLS